MRITKGILVGLIALTLVIALSACGTERTSNQVDEGLYVTTSFSVLADIISQVMGDRGAVDYVVPVGEEPHEYEPVSSDFANITDSDLFIVNGLDLEEWLERVVDNVSDTPIETASTGITPIPLEGDDESDPHAWLSVPEVKIYVENIVEHLIAYDPEGEETYRQNAERYLAELDELHEWIIAEVENIPEAHRVIAVSENAFKYFGATYGFETYGVWEINSHEEGTPQQIADLVDIVKDRNVPAVFVETTVDDRYMESVATDAGVSIAGEVFTDAIGDEESGVTSYIQMMRHNVETFVEGLSQ